MARLSNFLRRHDGPGDDSPDNSRSARECRLVQRHEIDQALRLLLSGPGGLARDEQVLDFLSYAMHRNVDVNATWIASTRGRIEWSLLPVVSPGKTMLMLSPTKLHKHSTADAVVELARAVAADYARRDIDLAQLLLDPDQPAVRDSYAAAGFTELAELVYLHRAVRTTSDEIALPESFALRSYSSDVEHLFADAIRTSYESSLDCPGLNGMRDMRDVIEGHRATGEFEPGLWHIVQENDQPRAVLLLNRSIHSEAMELVYIGLSPAARGRGLGDLLMRLAMHLSARDGKSELTLAVDSRNVPAMKLYFRHGMKRVGSRMAMIQDLRPLRQTETPMVPVAD
ncbi:MAG: GNAT family N-acetyltransferase [Anaerolineae bacterium]|nr:GNAT family N-acetyltransferase [Phycisphaerae bacterium]